MSMYEPDTIERETCRWMDLYPIWKELLYVGVMVPSHDVHR